MPVGTQSLAEYFVMDLPAPLDNLQETKANLNRQMPPGLEVQDITLSSGAIPQKVISSYQITLYPPLEPDARHLFKQFLQTDHFHIERTRKRKVKKIDIRPLVSELTINDDGTISIDLVSIASEAGAKPLEAIAAILKKNQQEFLASVVLKTGWKEL